MMRPPRGSSRPAPAALFVIALMWLSGCGSDVAAPDATVVTAPPVERTTERGPVRLTVRAAREEITVGEKLKVTIDVTAPPGIDITMPEPADPLGVFTVRNVAAPPDIPEEGRRRWTHVWTLDTFAVGATEIPAVTVRFVDRRANVEGGAGEDGSELSAGPLPVSVASVLQGDETPTDIHDIKTEAAIDVPTPPIVWWIVAATVLAVLGLLALVFFLRSRRAARAETPAPVVPAHIWAFDELDRLEREQLIERGEFHEFYFRLSDVVRQYIERRFGLMAPERTTDEFLRDAGHSSLLARDDREQLGGFLRAADMVKFALHEPSVTESREAFTAARDFVERTRLRETVNGAAAAPVTSVGSGAAA